MHFLHASERVYLLFLFFIAQIAAPMAIARREGGTIMGYSEEPNKDVIDHPQVIIHIANEEGYNRHPGISVLTLVPDNSACSHGGRGGARYADWEPAHQIHPASKKQWRIESAKIS